MGSYCFSSTCGLATPVLGFLFDILNPFFVRIMGPNINRRTMENIRLAGWRVVKVEHLFSDIVRWIEEEPGGDWSHASLDKALLRDL